MDNCPSIRKRRWFLPPRCVGSPLTPMSYAGVARRTTRRAVAVGAVATGAAVVAAPVVVAPACAQVVDAYGRIATVCR
jgi:hypothetical protein